MALGQLKPALQHSKGRSKPWAGARLVNAFAEKSDGDKADDFAVMAIPGLTEFADVASAMPVRGMLRLGALLHVIFGSTLYSVTSAAVATSLGAVGGVGPTRMVSNGTEIAIAASDTIGYVYSGGTVTAGPTNLPPVSDVAFIDGYFVWIVDNSDQFIISGLNDGLTYDPLDVATVEGAPDLLIGVINDHRELHFPGQDTWEIWYNSGNADFPFERQGNAFIERGCIDKNSLVKLDNSVFFVADDRTVRRLDGYVPARISTHALEYRLAQASYYRAFTYSQEGHAFYCLNTDVGTFCYDAATGAWHDRLSFGLDNYRIGASATAFGRILLGDVTTGLIYEPDLDSHAENGEPIPVIIELPPIETKRQRATMYQFELYCETGVGNSSAPNPVAAMAYSRDGGRTWSNEMLRPMGPVGEYKTRAVWRPNVQFRQLQIRLTMTDAVRRMVLGYYADIR
jgi:hypothetical protein